MKFGPKKFSPRQVDRVVNKTRRQSSLLTTVTTFDAPRLFSARSSIVIKSLTLASPPPGMPGTHPRIFGWGDVNGNVPQILLRTFGYSRPILVALRSLSLKPISFGYKTPPISFSQAGGQSAHKARPLNFELALTPLISKSITSICCELVVQLVPVV